MEPRRLSHAEYQKLILGPMDGIVQTMERVGVPISLTVLSSIEQDANTAVDEYKRTLNAWALKSTGVLEVNWNSWQQLLAIFDEAGIPRSPYYKKGKLQEGESSTDDGAVEWLLAHCPEHKDVLTTLREYRRARRIANYCEKWRGLARQTDKGYATLHPSFGLSSDNDSRPGAVTGRFAVKNPALNQVPSVPEKDKFGIKRAFVAPPGRVVVSVDASQLEVVLIAELATRLFGTTGMTQRLVAKEDFHIFTAKYIYGNLLGDARVRDTPKESFKSDPYCKDKRSICKNLRYGAHYLKGARAFGETLFTDNGDAIGLEMGQTLLNGLYEADPELPMLKSWGRHWVKRYGVACSAFGRWRVCTGWDSDKPGEFNRACRIYANWYPQTTGQELLVTALINIFNDKDLLGLGYVPVLPVHDEILGHCPEPVAEEVTDRVIRHVSTALTLLAPLSAEGGYGENWKVAK